MGSWRRRQYPQAARYPSTAVLPLVGDHQPDRGLSNDPSATALMWRTLSAGQTCL